MPQPKDDLYFDNPPRKEEDEPKDSENESD